MKCNKGVTLVELLIVIAIIGVLAAVGVPAYVGMQSRGAESEGLSKIEELRLLQEQYYAENGEYAPPVVVGTSTYKATPTTADDGIEDFLPGFQLGGCTSCPSPFGLEFIYTIVSSDTTGDGLADFHYITAVGAGHKVDESVVYIKNSLNKNKKTRD